MIRHSTNVKWFPLSLLKKFNVSIVTLYFAYYQIEQKVFDIQLLNDLHDNTWSLA